MKKNLVRWIISFCVLFGAITAIKWFYSSQVLSEAQWRALAIGFFCTGVVVYVITRAVVRRSQNRQPPGTT